MADFYIVPPRLIVGSFDRTNAVTSLNSLKGDLSLTTDNTTGIRVSVSGGNFRFSVTPNFYARVTGDTITGNMKFEPSGTNFGLSVGSGSANPGFGITGGLFFNTTDGTLKVYDGTSWGDILSTGGITEANADLRYLKLDGTNIPTANLSMGSQFLRFANLATQVSPGLTGQVFYNQDLDKLSVYTSTGWMVVGTAITAYAGTGISVNSSSFGATISVNESYNFTWTGSHTHTQAITFAAAQTFDINKLNITGQTSGDLIYFDGSNWNRLPIGDPNQGLKVLPSGTGITWGTVSASGGAGVSHLNDLTEGFQYFDVGTAGNLFNISSVGQTHTFNIPIAGLGKTGLVSPDAQTFEGIKTFNSNTIFAATTGSATTGTGSVVVYGGVGISGNLNVGGSTVIVGDLTVHGTTTTVNSTVVTVDDKNIELAATSSPSDAYAEGGGITLKGTSDKLIAWYSGVGWSSSESWNLGVNKTFKIDNIDVLSSTSLGLGVTNSSLTALGTITTGVWSGTAITVKYGGTGYTEYTKGDILVGAGSTFIKLPVGSNDYVLVADNTTASGIKWSLNVAPGSGVSHLNNLTDGFQYFDVGTSGNYFNISSVGQTHTFNIPLASTGSTGLVTNTTQTFGGLKVFNDYLLSNRILTNSGGLIGSTNWELAGTAGTVFFGILKAHAYNRFTGLQISEVDSPVYGPGYLDGNIVFYTDSEAQDFSTERMRIDGRGFITISQSASVGGTLILGQSLEGKYGGTGHSSYTKGDLIVGAGTSFVIQPVGTDNYVLTANSSSASGVTWVQASSVGSSVIGTPTDGVYTDGFFSSWTNETTVANAMDDINELLSLIAPSRPNYLTSTNLTASSVPSYYTVKISAGLGTEWYQAGYGTGSSISRYYLSGTFTLNTANTSTTFSAGSLTTSTYGVITFKTYNKNFPTGAGYGTIDLTSTYTVGTTNNNLKLTALDVYNNIWTKANAQILTYTQAISGYEGMQISHTENSQATNIYEAFKDAWSASNTTPSFATAATATTYAQTLKYLSGIGYYTSGTGFSVNFKSAAGIYSSCYNSTQIFAVSATGLATSSWNPSTPPLYSDVVDRTGTGNEFRVVLNSASASSFNQYLTVTLYKAHGTTATSNASISRYINTYTSLSTFTNEQFQDEDFRRVIDTDTPWTSTSTITNGNSQVRSGTLRYPVAADYDSEYPGSAPHSFTGDQEYQRYFYKTSASTGTLTFTGISGNAISAYGSGNLNMLLYLEGDALYYDLGTLQGSNANDGSSRSVPISAKTSSNATTLNWSIGTKSTGVSGTGNSARYRLIVIYKNNNPQITRIQSS